MAVITTSTFDPLRRYVGVRLQQGVPLVDADWNEGEDVRRFELRAFLKWFVGDGVPEGNDGFRIEGTGTNNDFRIRRGTPAPAVGATGEETALDHVGRFLVDGLDVMITADVRFVDQPLHQGNPGSAQEATRLGTSVVAALAPAAADGSVAVYLDVWERLVSPEEDPSLVHPGLNVESCARLRREWVVRARDGTAPPGPGDADFVRGHGYALLATVQRRTGDPAVTAGDVADRRERRLLAPPASLVEDALGVSPLDYRRGLRRPAVSLREAINALMRGELPSTPDSAIAPALGIDLIRRAFLFDTSGGIIAAWTSNRVGGTNQVFATRMDRENIAAGFVVPPQQVTAGAAAHSAPHAGVLPNGDLVVVYQTAVGAASDVAFRRAPLGGLGAAAEEVVAATGGVSEANPHVLVSGNLAVFLFHRAGATNQWQYRRRRHTDNTWVDATSQTLSATVTLQQELHAALDPAGAIWAAFRAGNDLRALRLTPGSGAVDMEITIDSGAGVDQEPFVLPRAAGEVLVFWRSPAGLHLRRFNGAWQAVQAVPGTLAGDREPSAVEDADGGIWLLWTRGAVGSGELFLARRDAATGAFGAPRQITLSPEDDTLPFGLMAPNQALWIFWSRNQAGDINPFFKRLVTAL
jgi:hypothetical protein